MSENNETLHKLSKELESLSFKISHLEEEIARLSAHIEDTSDLVALGRKFIPRFTKQ